MKKYLILLIIPLLFLTSCLKDNKCLLGTGKKNVSVDEIVPDNPIDGIPDGALAPGIHLVKQNVIYKRSSF